MTAEFLPFNLERFEAAVRRIDEENSRDPNVEQTGAASRPRELVYSEWLSDWVLRLEPHASEELRLAARGQHLCRWIIPRNLYPMTRGGYLRWREDLKSFHAEKLGTILLETGYPPEAVARVQQLVLKKLFPKDPESRVLEDALCLVFLERQFTDFTKKYGDEKTATALKKAWAKMTPSAQAIALRLPYGAREKTLLQKALGT